jgi:hypothetical protein
MQKGSRKFARCPVYNGLGGPSRRHQAYMLLFSFIQSRFTTKRLRANAPHLAHLPVYAVLARNIFSARGIFAQDTKENKATVGHESSQEGGMRFPLLFASRASLGFLRPGPKITAEHRGAQLVCAVTSRSTLTLGHDVGPKAQCQIPNCRPRPRQINVANAYGFLQRILLRLRKWC